MPTPQGQGGLLGLLSGNPTANAFRDGGMSGGFRNLFNQSMPGRVINGFRGLGDGVQGNGLAGFLGRGYNPGTMVGSPTNTTGVMAPNSPYTAGPPQSLAGYGGLSAQDLAGLGFNSDGTRTQQPELGGTDAPWNSWIQQWVQSANGMRGFQGGGLANRASDRVVTGGSGNMGGSSLNPLLAGDTSGGLGRLMNSFSPWRQSGITFGDRGREY